MTHQYNGITIQERINIKCVEGYIMTRDMTKMWIYFSNTFTFDVIVGWYWPSSTLHPTPPPQTWVTMETSATLQILILLQWGQFIIGTQSEHLRETGDGDRLRGATWDPTSTPGWTTELSQSLPRGANNAYDSYFVCMFSCLPATIYLSEIQNIMERIMFCSWCESREVHLENIW